MNFLFVFLHHDLRIPLVTCCFLNSPRLEIADLLDVLGNLLHLAHLQQIFLQLFDIIEMEINLQHFEVLIELFPSKG